VKRPVVVQLVQNLKRGGGIQRRLVELLPLLRAEVDVRVLCYGSLGDLADEVREIGIPVELVRRGGKWSPRTIGRYARYFRERGADVVHAHSFTGNTMGMVAAAAAGVPVRIRHLHTMIPWGREGRARTWLRILVDRWAAGRADLTLAVSAAARRIYLEGSRQPQSACRVLFDGVDLGRFSGCRELGRPVRREWGLQPGDLLVGTVGRLAEGKGHAEFLETARILAGQLPRARFAIVGEGPLRGSLEERAKAAGLGEVVRFAGFRGDVPAVLGAFDLFLFPGRADDEGRVPDGLPGVVIEANAAGLPVVAFGLPMMREIIPEDSVGSVVPCGDVAGMVRESLRYLTDPELAARTGAAAARNAERFSVEKCLQNTLALYDELLKLKTARTPGRETDARP
jgi:glycosyltransferase involved in cell wall biosynthesis